MKIKNKNSSGQALVTLLIFAIIGMSVITASIALLYANTSSVGISEAGAYAYYVTESGVEEALLRLIRDDAYSGGTLSVDQGTAIIQVQDGLITSTGSYRDAVKKIQVQTVNGPSGLTISSWKEIN